LPLAPFPYCLIVRLFGARCACSDVVVSAASSLLVVATSFDAANPAELLNKVFPDGGAGCENVSRGGLG
jgi:hypothetical protein